MKYYTTNNINHYAHKNKLQAELYNKLKQFESALIMDEKSMQMFIAAIKDCVNETNKAFPRCKPEKLSLWETKEWNISVYGVWQVSLCKVKSVIVEGDFHLVQGELELFALPCPCQVLHSVDKLEADENGNYMCHECIEQNATSGEAIKE